MKLSTLNSFCRETKNFFDRGIPYWDGKIVVTGGALSGFDGKLQTGQYFRITGSVFNDGIYRYPARELHDEEFSGTVRPMAVPAEVLELCDKIEAWRTKYEDPESMAMSPYQSESFAGYSYTKPGGSSAAAADGAISWQKAFAASVRRWKKL